MEGEDPVAPETTESTPTDIAEAPKSQDSALPTYAEAPAEDAVPAGTEPGDNADAKAGAQPGTITDELLDAAEALGLSRDEARALGSPTALETVIRTLDAKFMALGKNPQQQAQPPAPGAQATPAKQERPPIDPKFYEENYDEGVANLAKEVLELREMLSSGLSPIRERFQAQEEERITKDVDGFFDKFGAEGEGLFGKGAISTLIPNSPAYANRQKLVEAAAHYRSGMISSGLKPPSLETILQKAMQAEFGKQLSEAKLKSSNLNLAKAASKASATTIARPTQRRGTAEEADPKRRAAAKVQAKLEALGAVD